VTVRLSIVSPPQAQVEPPMEPQLLPEARLSPSQLRPLMESPVVPQPKKSLFRSPDSRQFVWHELGVQAGPVTVPERSAHTLQPVPETAAAKNDVAG
jgi:hypothetical protein